MLREADILDRLSWLYQTGFSVQDAVVLLFANLEDYKDLNSVEELVRVTKHRRKAERVIALDYRFGRILTWKWAREDPSTYFVSNLMNQYGYKVQDD